MTSCSVSQKVDTELGQAPTSQARPRDTDHLRPSNLAARTLSLVEHTLSKFGGDPCPVRRGIAGSGEVLCEKITFFRLLLNRTREARALCGFQHHKGENLFCFLFSATIIVGLNWYKKTVRYMLPGISECNREGGYLSKLRGSKSAKVTREGR